MIFLKDTVRPRNTEGNISDNNTLQENSEFSKIYEIENDSESDILSFANNPDIEQSLSMFLVSFLCTIGTKHRLSVIEDTSGKIHRKPNDHRK